MLEIARSRSERAELIECDITRSACLQGRSFDLITAFRFFPNAQPNLRSEALEILASLLTEEGYLVFNNHLNASSLMLRLARMLRASRGLGMTENEVRELVGSAGLRIVARYHLGVAPSNERVMVLPRTLLEPIERFASRWRALHPLAQNIIYVCQRDTRREP